MLCTTVSAVMLVVIGFTGPEQSKGGPGQIPPQSSAARVAARADATAFAPEYASPASEAARHRRRARRTGNMVPRIGLEAEATVHFMAALELDSGHEGAWNGLGFKRCNRGWLTTEQRIAYAHEANAQRKADGKWEPRLKRWKSWLRGRGEPEHGRGVPRGSQRAASGFRDLESLCRR